MVLTAHGGTYQHMAWEHMVAHTRTYHLQHMVAHRISTWFWQHMCWFHVLPNPCATHDSTCKVAIFLMWCSLIVGGGLGLVKKYLSLTLHTVDCCLSEVCSLPSALQCCLFLFIWICLSVPERTSQRSGISHIVEGTWNWNYYPAPQGPSWKRPSQTSLQTQWTSGCPYVINNLGLKFSR